MCLQDRYVNTQGGKVGLAALDERFRACKLELNRDKTKLVYCKNKQRKGSYKEVSFSFLGYDFQPRTCMGKSGA
ncbi:MAG: hypothetical protein RBR69_02555, partial [Candidatus Cloacimonadaceae bacterium]|nr:hypothetical protein [Candidatus Cloacimonadaceae bacterium]